MTSMLGPDSEPQRILIVEASKTHRRNLRDALADDYELHWATNARDALALAFTTRPHLILLDIHLEPPPIDNGEDNRRFGRNISGLEVCRQLKKSMLKDTPILILTASKGLIPRLRARLAHANAYLTKPIETQRLLDVIYQYLGSPRVRSLLSQIELAV